MTYPGGKAGAGVYQAIINQMPPHDIYIEAFLGGGAIMKTKKPARLASIAIDRDPAAIEAFRWPFPRSPFTAMTGDAIRILPNLLEDSDKGDRILVYCDPPYLMSTRSSPRRIYRWELEEEGHRRLLELLVRIAVSGVLIMLSGYPSQLYDQALAGWRRVSFSAMTRGGGPAQEVLWMNYPEPWELHDYRFLGSNFRARERLKRKIKRWQARLVRMDSLERAALMQAIQAVRFPAPDASPDLELPAIVVDPR